MERIRSGVKFSDKIHIKQRVEDNDKKPKERKKPRKGNPEERRRKEKCRNGNYYK
jgi:hypothetical protein